MEVLCSYDDQLFERGITYDLLKIFHISGRDAPLMNQLLGLKAMAKLIIDWGLISVAELQNDETYSHLYLAVKHPRFH